MRPLKHFNELVLYAGLSCQLAFATRLLDFLFYPALLLRLILLWYCIDLMLNVQKSRLIGLALCAALLIGWAGGYSDLIVLYLRFDPETMLRFVLLFILLPLIAFILFHYWSHAVPSRSHYP